HVLEVVVVLLRFIRSEFAQHSNGRGRGVEDVDAEAFGDPPGTAGIWIGGNPFVHDAGGRQGQWTVNDVGVTGNPANVGEAPVGVLWMDVLVVLRGAGHVRQVPPGTVLGTLGLGRGTAGVHQEQGSLSRHRHWLHDLSLVVGE